MEKNWPNASDPDEIYWSDDDSDLNEAYEQAMRYPLLSRVLDCNQSPRIVTITQPRNNDENLQPVENQIECRSKEVVSKEQFDELSTLVEQLSSNLTLQRHEITWFISQKQEMQIQIDFLKKTLLAKLRENSGRASTVGMASEVNNLLQAADEGQRRSVSTQTEGLPLSSTSSHGPLHLTISLHGTNCPMGTL